MFEELLQMIRRRINTSGNVTKTIAQHAPSIYGFFLGNKEGLILKEYIFNPEYCHKEILSNVVNAICSFAEDTKISDQGMIELSKSKISFVKIQDITYVLIHGLPDKKTADSLIEKISEIFEKRSRAKFHSEDPVQVFAGASAVFNSTVGELFSSVIEHMHKNKEKESIGLDLELVNVPLDFDEQIILPNELIKPKDKMDSSKQKVEQPTGDDFSREEKLNSITFNILNSLPGIEHLVFVEHDKERSDLFFQNGKKSENLVNKTLSICEKYLDNILELIEDESVENAIEVTEKYQIIFVPLNEKNFMYAIATKTVDPVMLNPVFERIAKRIKDAVLEYKNEL